VKRLNRENLRAAVIGLGKMGLLHASILNTFPNVELAALCDKSSLIRKVCKKTVDNIDVVDDVEKLSGLGLDAVYVTTPIPSHFVVLDILYSRKIANNVFVEKTLAANPDQAKKLCTLAQSFGGVNMVGYMKRFAVTFTKAKSLLAQNTLGDVVSFDAYAYSSDFFGCEKTSEKSAARGGVVRDLGAHVMDLALWFFGDLEVTSAKLEQPVEGGSEDSAQFSVNGADGLEGEFNISWCKENYRMPEFELVVNGSQGSMRVNDDRLELKLNDEKSSILHRHDLNDHVEFLLGAPEYFREDDYFISSVLEKRDGNPNFHTASKVDLFIDQVKSRAGKQ
jgi:predicted dehydrogenase